LGVNIESKMSLTEGLLVVIVLILTVIVVSGRMNHSAPTPTTKTWDCVNRDNGEITSVKMQYSKPGANPEKDSLAENAEHFESCRNSAEDTARALNCMCEGDDKFEYAVNEFGAPGIGSYKDYVAAQSVDISVLKNHSEFVADRMKLRGDNVLGKTWSPDSHDSDGQHWQGLRRPQAVPICNPLQIATSAMDNLDSFNISPKFTWNSSTTSVNQ
jgi:hypothetical protein